MNYLSSIIIYNILMFILVVAKGKKTRSRIIRTSFTPNSHLFLFIAQMLVMNLFTGIAGGIAPLWWMKIGMLFLGIGLASLLSVKRRIGVT